MCFHVYQFVSFRPFVIFGNGDQWRHKLSRLPPLHLHHTLLTGIIITYSCDVHTVACFHPPSVQLIQDLRSSSSEASAVAQTLRMRCSRVGSIFITCSKQVCQRRKAVKGVHQRIYSNAKFHEQIDTNGQTWR